MTWMNCGSNAPVVQQVSDAEIIEKVWIVVTLKMNVLRRILWMR